MFYLRVRFHNDVPAFQSEIEDMIWEVDDDCDKCVNWPEFQAMYHRCRNDKTGTNLEPTSQNCLCMTLNVRIFGRVRTSPAVQRG